MHRAAEPDEDPAIVTNIFVYLVSNESEHIHGKRFHPQEEE
jgi:hypothetical protein